MTRTQITTAGRAARRARVMIMGACVVVGICNS